MSGEQFIAAVENREIPIEVDTDDDDDETDEPPVSTMKETQSEITDNVEADAKDIDDDEVVIHTVEKNDD